MVVMQLSVSIDCPFLIATFSTIYTNLLHDNTKAVFILTVTIPHWRFMIFNIDMICPIEQRQRYYETNRTRYIPSATKYINISSIVFIVPFYLIT
jgi:hypothetical protein